MTEELHSRALSRAARLREIENLLFRHPQGMSVPEIAAVCGVNRRTIYRDLDLLGDSGVPIWQDGGKFGIIRDQYMATVRLRFQEAVALYIAARLLARHADEHNPHVVSALTKLSTAFPATLSEYINRTANIIQDRPINNTFMRVLEEISMCWAEGYKVRIWYQSRGSDKVKERDISPYTLEPSSSGGLYVIAFDEGSQEMRTFKLERVQRASRLAERYQIPDDFDAGSYLAGAWGIMRGDDTPTQIHLRFKPHVAPLVRERIWHPSQHLEVRPDGSIDLWFQIGDIREIYPWVISWGSEVEVLEPADLREMITEEIRKLHEIYAD